MWYVVVKLLSCFFKVHPVIITRILEENGNLLAANFDDDDIISIYQFTDYFLLDNR